MSAEEERAASAEEKRVASTPEGRAAGAPEAGVPHLNAFTAFTGRWAVLRAALRISRRDAWRAKGRTALIMVMIGLPVLVITALITGRATTDVTPYEQLDSTLGSADARLITFPTRGRVRQDVAARSIGQHKASRPDRQWTPAELGTLLDGRLLRYQQKTGEVRLPDGYDWVDVLEVDLRDPMTRGMRELVEGRFPAAPGEVAVSPALTGRGARIGGTLPVTRDNRPMRVVGVVQNPNRPGSAELTALPEAVLGHQNDGDNSGWLADTPGSVRRADVRRLNQAGLAVQSRALIERLPDDGESPVPAMSGSPTRGAVSLGVAIVLVVMETVLLAGPAFAVGLRRRRRELAVLAAQGASGRQLKAVVLADGLVLGGAAALMGMVLGIGAGALIASVGAPLLNWTHGPLDVPWPEVLAVAALGVVSGVTAALVPAVQASRQSPAQVLAGRAAVDPPGRAARPLLGLVLVVLGTGGCFAAARHDDLAVVISAVVLALGLIVLMPWLVRSTGRLAGRLPLPLRLSVRDAARHRVRTSSAAGAVMGATMAAVVLGLVAASAFAQREAERTSVEPLGTLTIRTWASTTDGQWSRLRVEAERLLPGVPLVPGAVAVNAEGKEVRLQGDRHPLHCAGPTKCLPPRWDGGGILPVGDERLLTFLLERHDPRAEAALARGSAVVIGSGMAHDGVVQLVAESWEGGEDERLTLPAVVAKAAEPAQTGALIPASALEKAGFTVVERHLYAAHVPADEARLQRALNTVASGVNISVERRGDEDALTVLLVLLGAAMVLVLGGTFAATGLAAADMRQDLDTMSAVGAAPRVRRLVVAAQAAYLSGLGAAVGLAGGAVGGAALIRWNWETGIHPGGHPQVVEIPWLFLAGLVVGLPLLAALVAGTFTRTRPARARRVA
ncbi:FtsX-like permease family protein [Nonomuraea terrae]|uniref:FtsX-like permease family protein n=1 Tax=Nonomuraea terrae TaxID=2530383 RepID=A0A4R4YRA2_9ACTN|nr:FtsX-like permease family protein [Nonomuraea terrae]TDD47775.1 FtsX-like permease family protein [Nonomuraea terrae]